MIEHQNNELAIIFEIICNGDITKVDCFEIKPIKVVFGDYDEDKEQFIDYDNNAYDHALNTKKRQCFLFNYPILTYLSLYSNCLLSDIEEFVLNEAKKYKYYFSENHEKANIIVTDSNSSTVTYVTDQICDEFTEALNSYYQLLNEKNKYLQARDPVLTDETVPDEFATRTDPEKEVELNIKRKIDTIGLYETISSYIISQDDGIRDIVGTIWNNYNTDNTTMNILIIGPTGVGKTEVARIISKYISVPMITVGANNFSQVGYIGNNVTDMLKSLLIAANNNVEKAMRGIIVIDEIDKIASRSNNPNNVATSAVQYELLKMIEDGEYIIDGKKLNTRNITFIALGAFDGINKKVSTPIGFDRDVRSKYTKDYSEITYEDLEKFGLISQLLGRFPVLVHFNDLEEEDFIKIMKQAKGNLLKRTIELYKKHQIELVYNEELLTLIAKKAKILNLGVRGLEIILGQIFKELNFLMSQDISQYSSIEITSETLTNPKKYILRKNETYEEFRGNREITY